MGGWAVALLVGLIVGGGVGFFVGLRDGMGVMAGKWLERHPEDGDLSLRDDP